MGGLVTRPKWVVYDIVWTRPGLVFQVKGIHWPLLPHKAAPWHGNADSHGFVWNKVKWGAPKIPCFVIIVPIQSAIWGVSLMSKHIHSMHCTMQTPVGLLLFQQQWNTCLRHTAQHISHLATSAITSAAQPIQQKHPGYTDAEETRGKSERLWH